MFRRGFWRMGVAGLVGSAGATGVTILAKDSSDNIVLCVAASTAIPAGTSGYAMGCILINSTTGVIHSNVGSATSCTFYAVGWNFVANATYPLGWTGGTA